MSSHICACRMKDLIKTLDESKINNHDLTPSHFAVGILWVTKMSSPACWDLTPSEAASLLGMSAAEFTRIQETARQNGSFFIEHESVERLSLLLGIWKRLQLIFFHEHVAISAFHAINKGVLLNGKSIKSFLLESNSPTDFYALKFYLDDHIGY